MRVTETTAPETLRNANVYIEYKPAEKHIFARDLRDLFNEPACYNTKKRGVKRAWQAIVVSFNERTTLHDVMELMSANGAGCHYWCMVD